MQKTCIVIPCYNEAERLSVREFEEFYNYSSIHFCFANDGSTDSTLEILQKIALGKEERISIFNLQVNSGKAEAIRQAIHFSLQTPRFEYIGFLDADFSTPLSEIDNLLQPLQNNQSIMMTVGSRIRLLGRVIERRAIRHYSGRIFSTFASIMLKLPVYDTQCGAKILSSKVALQVFKEKFISSWLFDVEIFFRFQQLFGVKESEKIIIEVPLLQWIEKRGSKIKPVDLFKIPLELIKIKSAYKIKP